MKLHLPTGLRAALIAAFAVAGTLAQAAITTYDVTTWTTYDQSAGAAVVGGGTAQKFDYSETFNNNWSFVVTVTADSIKGDSALTLLALSLQQQGGTGLAEGITLADNGSQTATLTSWSAAAAGGAQTLDLNGVTDLTFVLSHSTDKNLTMKVYADNNFSSAIATATQGGQSFSNTTVDHVALGGMGGMSKYAHNANQVTFPDDASTGTFAITKAGYLFDAVITENDLIKYYTPPSTLVWNSTSSATWDLSTANWVAEGETTPTVFVDYSTAVFGSGSSLMKNIVVEGTVNVDVMNVQAGYTFTADSGSALMVDTLNVADGQTATMAGEGTISLGALSGALSINAGATVNMTGTISLTGTQTLQVSGEGKLAVTTLQVTGGEHTISSALEVNGGGDGTGANPRKQGLAVTGGTINLTGATLITGALYNAVGTVNIGDGTNEVRVETNRVEFGDNGAEGTSTLNVKENAILHVRAGDVANAYANTGLVLGEWVGVSVANIAGKLYAENATAYVGDNMVTFNIQDGGLMAVQGFSQNQHKDAKAETINLNLQDGGKVVLGSTGITSQKPIIIDFAAGEVGISDYNVEIAKDVTLTGSGTTFNTAVYEWTGSEDTLELETGEAGGALTVSGNITGAGSIIKAGDGTLTLSGGANVITHVITLNKGELVLGGTFDVTALASGGGTGDYVEGDNEGNGFLQFEAMTAHVVDIADDATVSGDGTFTANGATGTLDTATGNVSFEAGVTYTTLYVNVANTTESLDHAITASSGDMREAILKSGTTLALDSADAVLPQLTLAADADAALNVTANTAITKATGAAGGHTLTINGTAGSTLTIGATGADSYAGAGTLVIAEGATVLLRGNNTNFTGNIEVNGTLIVGTGINANVGTGVFGAENIAATSTRTFTINSTGVLDFNGQPDTKYAYVLAGGKLTNSGNDIPEGKAQMSGLKLTADSTVEAGSGHDFWLLSAGYAANTLDLGDNTLVKTGDGRFGFKTTSISTGTLEAREGVIHFSNSNTVANMLLSGGTFTGGVDVKGDITVHATVGADMSAALNIAEAGKVITFDVDADQTLKQTGMVNGAGSIVKNGAGILEMSGAAGTTAPGTLTGVQVNAGTLKVTAANVLGSGPITVAAGATLDMTAGNVLAGTQSVTNSGNVIIHNTLTSGSVNGGSLILAGDFPTTGELLDVDGLNTGNGFSQGGTIQVFDPTKATLDVTEIKHGDTTYHMDNLEEGAITLSGADWSTYQLKVDAGEAQPTIAQIMAWADQKGGAAGTLKNIAVSGENLDLVVDVPAEAAQQFKTSMLSGDQLASLGLTLVDKGVLVMDADLAGNLTLGGLTEDASATVVLEKDVAAQKSLWAYNMEGGGISTLTIKGAHTLTTPLLGSMFGKFVLQEGATLAVASTSFGLSAGDSIDIQDTAKLDLGNVNIKSVDETKTATMKNESDEDAYDIGSTAYSLTDARVTFNYSDAHNFGHELKGTSALVNAGTASVNDINALNTEYDELHAQNGDIYLSGRTSGVAVRDLTVGEGRGVYMNDSDETLTVTGEASFGSGAKVSSALTMAGGSTL
ncbi:MAG: hypothetical protein Q4C88_07685, partial [Akkermansia sp.]|nr:hypothetical protein [Akkermansia sp.]